MKDYQVVKLDNFIIILSNFATKSIYCDFAFQMGSRYESKENNGLTHLSEHICGDAIVNSINSHSWIKHYIDDTFRAYTLEDRTNFEFTLHQKDLSKVVNLVSKIEQGIKTKQKDLDITKGVILEELKEYEDDVEFIYYNLIRDCYFQKSSLKNEVLGSKKNIRNFTLQEVNAFIKKYYILNNLILTIAGDFKNKSFKENLLKELTKIKKKTKKELPKRDFQSFSLKEGGLHIVSQKEMERVFFTYRYPIFDFQAEDNVEWEFFQEILNNYLFYQISSKLSLYSVGADLRTYSDFIDFSLNASFDYKKTEDFIFVLLKELQKFKKNFNIQDFNLFKERKMASLDLDKEDIKEGANMLSWYTLIFGPENILTLSDQQEIIKKMEFSKIQDFFNKVFKNKGVAIFFGKITESKKRKIEKIWNDWLI